MSYRYSQQSDGVTVQVVPNFIKRAFRKHNYTWCYDITITNNRSHPVKLLQRHWEIFDASGTAEVISGEGVIGQQPLIDVGDSFDYTSSVNLWSNSGMMLGYYLMHCTKTDQIIQVLIPCFSLDYGEVIKH